MTRPAALVAAALLLVLTATAWIVSSGAGDSGLVLRDTSTTVPHALTVVAAARGSAADVTGLKPGDRITQWKTWAVSDPSAPFRWPHALHAGDRVTLTVQRLIAEPPAGVAGFDRYQPDESIVLTLQAALTREWPGLLVPTGLTLVACAAAVLAAVRAGSRRNALLSLLAVDVALLALAAPLAETALRLPHARWLVLAGWLGAALAPGVVLVLTQKGRGSARSSNSSAVRFSALGALLVYAAVIGIAAVRVGNAGDDGLRARPVQGQGLAITRTLPGSPAALAGISGGRWIVGVDGLVTRDAHRLWWALSTRPPQALSRLQLQGTVRTGTGTGLGGIWDGQVQLRPRLTTPLVATGTAAVVLAGFATLAIGATVSGRPARRSEAARPLLALACCAALLAALRVWAEAGYTARELAPFVFIGIAVGTVLVWQSCRPLSPRARLGASLSVVAAALLATAEPILTATTTDVRSDVAELLSFASGIAPALPVLTLVFLLTRQRRALVSDRRRSAYQIERVGAAFADVP